MNHAAFRDNIEVEEWTPHMVACVSAARDVHQIVFMQLASCMPVEPSSFLHIPSSFLTCIYVPTRCITTIIYHRAKPHRY